MEFLGSYLSPNNSISLDQDKLTKYFYFRPDQYDDPAADFENILKVKLHPDFPKRYDTLEENTRYAIDTIDVAKRINDETAGSQIVSFIATATYDLLDNILKRENTGGGGSGDSEETIYIDEDGNKVTADTPPWKLKGEWNWTPVEVVIPFTKGYDDLNQKVVNVVNSAGNRLFAETVRHRLEITYSKNYKNIQNDFSSIMDTYVNSDRFYFNKDKQRIFEPNTLLIMPPTVSLTYYEKVEEDTESNETTRSYVPYYTYNVRMIYDPEGWDVELLQTGTFAKFGNSSKAEQIYSYTIVKDTVVDGPYFGNAATALKQKRIAEEAGFDFSMEAVTEPMPLTDTGQLYTAAINDPTTTPYLTKKFKQYKKMVISSLPWEKKED